MVESGPVAIPAEAVEAFTRGRDSVVYGNTQAGLRAAAPLIVAAALTEEADRIEHSAGAWGDPKPGTPAYSMQGVLADVVAELRERASVLRGEGPEQ